MIRRHGVFNEKAQGNLPGLFLTALCDAQPHFSPRITRIARINAAKGPINILSNEPDSCPLDFSIRAIRVIRGEK